MTRSIEADTISGLSRSEASASLAARPSRNVTAAPDVRLITFATLDNCARESRSVTCSSMKAKVT